MDNAPTARPSAELLISVQPLRFSSSSCSSRLRQSIPELSILHRAKHNIRSENCLPTWDVTISIPTFVMFLHQPRLSSSISSKPARYLSPSSVIKSHCERSSFFSKSRPDIAATDRSVKHRHPSSERASNDLRWEIFMIPSSVKRRQFANERVCKRSEEYKTHNPSPTIEWQLSNRATSRLRRSLRYLNPTSVSPCEPRRSSSVKLLKAEASTASPKANSL
mmetsp:Transcript_1144/g.2307  ORF Transcript_1144/g.2307 Transcript_1144/m.2307 type:complete len:221 (-) Transcript_1144:2145-2807(-)